MERPPRYVFIHCFRHALPHHTLSPSFTSVLSHPKQAWQVAQRPISIVCRHRTLDGRQAVGPF